jgi:hypothetical protein
MSVGVECGGDELVVMGTVRCDGKNACRTAPDEFSIDEDTVASPHIEKQSSEVIACYDVAAHVDEGSGGEKRAQQFECFRSVALDGSAGVLRLRRVDSEQSNRLPRAGEIDDDRVTVDDLDHERAIVTSSATGVSVFEALARRRAGAA